MPLHESSTTTHASQWVVIDNHFLRRPPLPNIQLSTLPDKWQTPKQIQHTHHTTSLGRHRKRHTTWEPPNDDTRIDNTTSIAIERQETPRATKIANVNAETMPSATTPVPPYTTPPWIYPTVRAIVASGATLTTSLSQQHRKPHATWRPPWS